MASHLTASRLLAAILLSNLLTLSVLNALRAPTIWMLAYPLVALLVWRCLKPRSVRRPQTALPRTAWWLAGVTFVLLCVPRLPWFFAERPQEQVTCSDWGACIESRCSRAVAPARCMEARTSISTDSKSNLPLVRRPLKTTWSMRLTSRWISCPMVSAVFFPGPSRFPPPGDNGRSSH